MLKTSILLNSLIATDVIDLSLEVRDDFLWNFSAQEFSQVHSLTAGNVFVGSEFDSFLNLRMKSVSWALKLSEWRETHILDGGTFWDEMWWLRLFDGIVCESGALSLRQCQGDR